MEREQTSNKNSKPVVRVLAILILALCAAIVAVVYMQRQKNTKLDVPTAAETPKDEVSTSSLEAAPVAELEAKLEALNEEQAGQPGLSVEALQAKMDALNTEPTPAP